MAHEGRLTMQTLWIILAAIISFAPDCAAATTDSRWVDQIFGGCRLQSGGRLAEAEIVLAGALVDAEQYGKNSPQAAAALDSLTNVEVDLGHYSSAERHFRHSVSILKAAFGPADLNTVTVLRDLATMYLELGQYAGAQHVLEGILDTRLKVLGSGDMTVAQAVADLGSAHALQHKYDIADRMYRQALSILETHVDKDDVRLARVLGTSRAPWLAPGPPCLMRSARGTSFKWRAPRKPI
jgi:tetratricopeptide (TPR) repeat protein